MLYLQLSGKGRGCAGNMAKTLGIFQGKKALHNGLTKEIAEYLYMKTRALRVRTDRREEIDVET
jgi:hypothetical protein